ncbi:MAG: peptide deformylase [Myxococcales bacterium]|nr:MAG: peptide deformylase [Myxococcales bacterium]
MALLEIIEYPDKRLRLASKPVETIDARIRRLAADMAETMYAAPGIGLAAIQVGEPLRLIVCDVHAEGEDAKLLTVINPEIVATEGEVAMEEGCLSLPGIFEEVRRFAKVGVDYLDLDGERRHIDAEGLLAVCLQHEIDHLDGKVIFDRLSSLKRKLAVRRLERFKAEREAKEASAQKNA